jgi:class 3 adenylate cyclase
VLETNIESFYDTNCRFFFSDIVGFTNLASQIYPWDIVGLLNRLYGVMDFLAGRFNLFKVETIGDAYVCCSGLPQADEVHAKNVANFAIAVKHCCRQELSPLDNSPIQLRIGIHSGSCASGVVGMTNPR